MSTINTIGKVQLPFTFYGTIVGSYADTTTRVIEVSIDKVVGTAKLPPFPNQPVCWGSMGSVADGTVVIGITGARRDVDHPDHRMVIKVDRGFSYDQAGQAQPVAYAVPKTADPLCFSTPTAMAMEVAEWAVGVQALVEGLPLGTDGIVKDVANEFAVSAQTPEALGVVVGTGVAVATDGLINQAAAENVALEPVFTLPAQAGYLMIARIYISKLTGEIGVAYGAAHVDTPVAPAYPANTIKLAAIALTEGDATVATADITDERAGL